MSLKIISGGQTGADRTALEIAHGLGFGTGGYAPKGYRTEAGPDLELKTKFGLLEAQFSQYDYRTKMNVENSDLTVWVGHANTPGYKSTYRAAGKLGRPFIVNPDPYSLFRILLDQQIRVLNVAGNRLSVNIDIVKQTHYTIGTALSRYKRFMQENANQNPAPISSEQNQNVEDEGRRNHPDSENGKFPPFIRDTSDREE